MALGRVADVTEEPDWQAWAALNAKELLGRLVNDLEPPAFAIRPELNDLRQAIEQLAPEASPQALTAAIDKAEAVLAEHPNDA